MVTDAAKNILVIKWGALGDLIAATPAIKSLRDNFPHSKIVLLTNPLMKQIIPAGFLVDELILINTNRNKVEDSLFKQISTAINLRRKKFDLAINLRWTSERAALLTYLSGAKIRVSSGPKNLMNLYTIKLEHPVGRYHEIHRNLDIIKALGVNQVDENPILFISDEEQKKANDFFSENNLNEFTLCIHPGASKAIRAWMPERFAEIGKRFAEEFNGKVFVTWSGNESSLADYLINKIGKRAVKSFETKTIGQLAALIKNCKMFFSNCTGPMNVAVAVKTPVIALLGSSDETDWGAYGKIHINIKSPLKLEHYSDEDERRAMEAISVDNVWNILSNRWKELI